jgi:hypothetical protein
MVGLRCLGQAEESLYSLDRYQGLEHEGDRVWYQQHREAEYIDERQRHHDDLWSNVAGSGQ